MQEPLSRVSALLGETTVQALQRAHVLVVGAGAVGGACIEALARTGVGRLTIVDGDCFEESNLNRQPFASQASLQQPKATSTCEQLAQIAPHTHTQAYDCFVTPENVVALLAEIQPTHIVDACDDIPAKVALLTTAHAQALPVWSAMGAARKLDPTALRITDISKTQMCPLAKIVRKHLRECGIHKGVRCVWSIEPAHPQGPEGTLGSYMPVTATAGLLLAADLVQSLSSSSHI